MIRWTEDPVLGIRFFFEPRADRRSRRIKKLGEERRVLRSEPIKRAWRWRR